MGGSVGMTLPLPALRAVGVDPDDPRGWIRIRNIDIDPDTGRADFGVTVRAAASDVDSDDTGVTRIIVVD